MNAGQNSTWSQHCWTLLRAARNTAVYAAVPLNVVRRLYLHWTTVLPNPVTSILFVCHGNICRSPFAAVYFQALLKKEGMSLAVCSAGLDTTPGKPAHSTTRTMAEAQQLSLAEHLTTQLHTELVNQSDLIVVMEIAQKHRIHRLYPASKGKVVLLGYFDPKGPLEIADPYGRTMDHFRSCFGQVARCCDNLAGRLRVGSRPSPTDRASTAFS